MKYKAIIVLLTELILIGFAGSVTARTSKTSISNNFGYKIVSDVQKRNIKRTVEVLLDEKVSKDSLKKIALIIKNNDSESYERTFIGYSFKGQTQSGYWARTDFNPDLKIRIYGQPANNVGKVPKPKQYDNIYDFFADANDYPTDDQFKDGKGQFRVLSKKPILHIEINPNVMKNDFPQTFQEETKRAILYGIYRTFIHTKFNDVKVTAIPIEVSFNKQRTKRIKTKVLKYQKTVTISREMALNLIKESLGLSSFTDLVTPFFFGKKFSGQHTNSRKFEQILYNDRKPGLDNFFLILENLTVLKNNFGLG